MRRVACGGELGRGVLGGIDPCGREATCDPLGGSVISATWTLSKTFSYNSSTFWMQIYGITRSLLRQTVFRSTYVVKEFVGHSCASRICMKINKSFIPQLLDRGTYMPARLAIPSDGRMKFAQAVAELLCWLLPLDKKPSGIKTVGPQASNFANCRFGRGITEILINVTGMRTRNVALIPSIIWLQQVDTYDQCYCRISKRDFQLIRIEVNR